jgi:dihydroorotase
LRLEPGDFGFVDVYGARLRGSQKLTCEMTLRNGKIVYELNGLSRPDWTSLPKNYRFMGNPRWDGMRNPLGGLLPQTLYPEVESRPEERAAPRPQAKK